MDQSLKTLAIISTMIFTLSIIFIGLGDALIPLLFSFALSYLLFPIIKKLESKGLKRNITVPITFGFIVILFILVFALIAPKLGADAQGFLKELPKSSDLAIKKIERISNNLGLSINLSKESLTLYLKEHLSELSGGLLKGATRGIRTSFTGILNWFLAILNLFLIPLFFFYVVNDFERITLEIKSFIPKSFIPKISHYFELCNNVLNGYIRGQLMVALVLCALYSIGLSIIGLKFGVLIGIISGILSIIPYAGFTIGFLTAIIIALANFTGVNLIFGIIIVFVIVQTLEGLIITPKLVGDKVGLSALATMLALIIGGNLLGLFGMLIAIPLAAILKSCITDLKIEYQKLEIFKL